MLKNIFLQFIKAYQYGISPFLGSGCRFHPTCSVYAYEAVARYGPGRGVWLSIKRILRCHPFHAGGVDPVPTYPIKSEG